MNKEKFISSDMVQAGAKKCAYDLYQALHPDDVEATEQDCVLVSLNAEAHNDFAMLAKGKLLIFAEAETIVPDMLAARMMLHLVAAYENLGGVLILDELPMPELYVVYIGDDAVKPEALLSVEFGCFTFQAKVLQGDRNEVGLARYVKRHARPRFRINAHCPHCGEEHLWLDISLTDTEWERYAAFYARYPRRVGLDDLLEEAPLVVEREICCGVCRKTFSQSFGIWKSIETSNMSGVGEILVHGD